MTWDKLYLLWVYAPQLHATWLLSAEVQTLCTSKGRFTRYDFTVGFKVSERKSHVYLDTRSLIDAAVLWECRSGTVALRQIFWMGPTFISRLACNLVWECTYDSCSNAAGPRIVVYKPTLQESILLTYLLTCLLEPYCLSFSLSMKMDLNIILMRAEELFFKYCRKSVEDCFQVVDIETMSWCQQTVASSVYTNSFGAVTRYVSLQLAKLHYCGKICRVNCSGVLTPHLRNLCRFELQERWTSLLYWSL